MKYLLLLFVGFCLHTASRAQGCTTNYVDPTFQLKATDLTCYSNSGKIEVDNPSGGVPPYTYRLVELNLTNSTGVFTGLAAGMYSVEMRDACGTVRTRQATLVPFQFSFTYTVTVLAGDSTTCRRAQVSITPSDPSIVAQYGIHPVGTNDTTWSSSSSFVTNSVAIKSEIFVRDNCGNLHTDVWNGPKQVFGYIQELQYRLQCDKVDIFPVYFGFNNPNVCLYDFATKALIQCKSATGSYNGGALTNFFDVPYGKPYYVIVSDACSRDSAYFPDKMSSGGSQIDPYDWDCNQFKMHVDGPPPPPSWYARHPEVDGSPDSICLYDLTRNIKVGCKSTDDHLNWINPRTGVAWSSGAVWDSLPYGTYRAYIYDPCSDSTFKMDSTVVYPFKFRSELAAHCSITQTAVETWFDPGAKKPFNVKVIYPDGSIAANQNFNDAYAYLLYNTWPQAGNIKVIVSDACGHSDSTYIQQEQIYPVKSYEVKGGCPGLYGLSGGGDIMLAGNHGAYQTATVTIIKRDGVDTLVNKSYSNYNTTTGNDEFYFSNLPTGTYIVQSSVGCFGMKLYDTVQISPYAYPNQIADKIYQCGDNPYTFKDSTTHGVRPFTYEVLNTYPTYAPLMTGPQASNVFNIPVGSSIDSVSIKVLDYCGNSHTKTFPVQHMADCNTLVVRPPSGGASTISNHAINVYPNPSTGQFAIAISQKKKTNYRIDVFNTSGILLYQKMIYNVDKKEVIVNEHLIPGLYIVKVTDLIKGDADVFKQTIY